MKLIRYQTAPLYTPSRNYPSLRDEVDRLFDAAFPALTTLHNGFFGQTAEFPVDLYQDKNAYYVRAELPGFRKEDVGVEVADGVLTITGQEKSGEKEEVKAERHVNRAVSLPENADAAKVSAAYENGVLTVTLPKREEIKPRQIAVEVK